MKKLKGDIVKNDEILRIVNETVGDDKAINDCKNNYLERIEQLEEALINYMGENGLKIL